MVDNKPPVTPAPPPPPPPPPVAPVTPDPLDTEARLYDHMDSNAQPIHDPNTNYPSRYLI